MTAFAEAWEVTKMPIYHGTSTKYLPDIMREGLKPTSTIPDAHARQMIDDMGYSDDDPIWLKEWLYGVANRLAEPARYAVMAGSAREPRHKGYGAKQLYPTSEYLDAQFDTNSLPVILEMPDDAGDKYWIDDPVGAQGFGDGGWLRTGGTVPPEQLRVLAQAEPDMTVGQFIEMIRNRSKEMGLEEDEDDFEFF